MAIYHAVISIPFSLDHGAKIVTDDSGHWLIYPDLSTALDKRQQLSESQTGSLTLIYQVMELEL